MNSDGVEKGSVVAKNISALLFTCLLICLGCFCSVLLITHVLLACLGCFSYSVTSAHVTLV